MSPNQNAKLSKQKLATYTLFVLFFIALAWYANNLFSLEDLAQQEDRFRFAIAQNPLQSFLIGFAIYTALALVPGTGGKAIIYSWLFGFWQAMLIVTVGLSIAAMIIFALSRYLFQATIERRYTSFVKVMNEHIEKEGAFYLLTLRMMHAPFSIVNPVSGASRVRSWTFFWTTVVGLIPANAIWAYVGLHLPSLRELAAQGTSAFVDPPLITALIACGVFPIFMRWLFNRFGVHTNDIS
ncbi:MAG: TVP38/TMEM64 family protein [Gammaproteobacteria bacterium]